MVVLAGCTAREASRVAGEPTLQPGATSEPGRHSEDTDGWFLRSVSDDGRTIGIAYTISGVATGCEKQGRSYADESRHEVTIHAVKSVTDDRNMPCTEELGYVGTTVVLDEPLGTRLLLGCLQTWEQDEFAEEASTKQGENRMCRDRTRGESGLPSTPFPSG
jgi:hypothetical protein